MHPVPAPGQRRGIGTRGPGHIEHPRGGPSSSRASNSIDLANSSEGRPSAIAGALIAGAVVTFDHRINHCYGLSG
jgi:hypothetical protein